MSTKAKTRSEPTSGMDRLIDDAVARANAQGAGGPPELRAGRYRPDLAEHFAAERRAKRG